MTKVLAGAGNEGPSRERDKNEGVFIVGSIKRPGIKCSTTKIGPKNREDIEMASQKRVFVEDLQDFLPVLRMERALFDLARAVQLEVFEEGL